MTDRDSPQGTASSSKLARFMKQSSLRFLGRRGV